MCADEKSFYNSFCVYNEDLNRTDQTAIHPSARTATIILPTTSWRAFPTSQLQPFHLSFCPLLPQPTPRQLNPLLPLPGRVPNPPAQPRGPLTHADRFVPLARRAPQKTMEVLVLLGHRGEVLEAHWIDLLLTSPHLLYQREPWRWFPRPPSPNLAPFTPTWLRSGSPQLAPLPTEMLSGEEELEQGR